MKKWEKRRVVKITPQRSVAEQRLTDLALAMIIPWADGFPQYIGDVDSDEGREWLLEKMKGVRLPWEM